MAPFNRALTLIGNDQRQIGARKHRASHPTDTFEPLSLITERRQRQQENDMALKVELKPHERIIIGSCVITNTDQRARLLIDGDNIPILRGNAIRRLSAFFARWMFPFRYQQCFLLDVRPPRRSRPAHSIDTWSRRHARAATPGSGARVR